MNLPTPGRSSTGHRGHPICRFTSKAACDQYNRELLGKCQSLTADKHEPIQCPKWATSLIDGQPICDFHAHKILTDRLAAEKAAAAKAAMTMRLDAYIERSRLYPSIFDERRKAA